MLVNKKRTKRYNIENFISASNKLHNCRYDYSKVNYVNNKIKVKIICKQHGEFTQRPTDHITRVQGCPLCSGNKRLTTEIFIEKSNITHNHRYDYSKSIYNNINSLIEIVCKEHGVFKQSAHNHINGQGCAYCSKNKIIISELLNCFSKKHNNKYDYSKVNYINSYEPIEIICKLHGSFFQKPTYHKNHGCSKCAGVYKKNTDEFIIDANKIHNNLYNYDKSIYICSKTKLSIQCKKHGFFEQSPNSHLKGRGCPKCKRSTGEKLVCEFLESNNISYIEQFTLDNYKYDFFLFDYNLIIEYDGIQHFEPVKHFGGITQYEKQIEIDTSKNKKCIDKGIDILRISYKDKLIINNIITNKLKNPL